MILLLELSDTSKKKYPISLFEKSHSEGFKLHKNGIAWQMI